jgi:hypothetical protein
VIWVTLGFVIAAEINPDEASAVAACANLANFASHGGFLLARKERQTLGTLNLRRGAGIHQLIEKG